MSSQLFVNGTLMRGLKLNANLDGATFLGEFRTAPKYRIYSIGDVHPGMFEVANTSTPKAVLERAEKARARLASLLDFNFSTHPDVE